MGNAYPDIQGWAMVGGWPLFTKTLLTDLSADKLKIVVRGRAARAARPTSRRAWPRSCSPSPPTSGATSASTTIVKKIYLKEDVPARIPMELVRVTKDNLGTWARQLKDWGFTDVPEEYLKLDASR